MRLPWMRPRRDLRAHPLMTRGLNGVVEQHRDGHGADAARHGRDGGRDLLRLLEFHVSDEAISLLAGWIVDAVHTDVDDHRARFNHRAPHELRLPDPDDEAVRLPRRLLDGART